jgi:hypothetical protein
MESGATRVHTTSAATVEAEMATYMASASVLLVELRGGGAEGQSCGDPEHQRLGTEAHQERDAERGSRGAGAERLQATLWCRRASP